VAFAAGPRRERRRDRDDRPLFVYDGDCRFCRKWAGWLQHRVGSAVRFSPFQALDDLARFDLTIDDVRRASYLIEDGRSYVGGRGIARAMAHGRRVWRLVGRLLDLPGLRRVTALVYRWIARNRHRLPAPDHEVTV
jgi:predicted DCC family thiol-disulfide oxidoreductase YuxK